MAILSTTSTIKHTQHNTRLKRTNQFLLSPLRSGMLANQPNQPRGSPKRNAPPAQTVSRTSLTMRATKNVALPALPALSATIPATPATGAAAGNVRLEAPLHAEDPTQPHGISDLSRAIWSGRSGLLRVGELLDRSGAPLSWQRRVPRLVTDDAPEVVPALSGLLTGSRPPSEMSDASAPEAPKPPPSPDKLAGEEHADGAPSSPSASDMSDALSDRGKASTHEVCPHCHGAGWVREAVPIGDPRFGQALPCACQQMRLHDRWAAQTLRASNLTPAMAYLTFASFHPSAKTMALYQRAQAFAADPHGWLFLHGGYGVGKTHLLAAIANASLAASERPSDRVAVPTIATVATGDCEGSQRHTRVVLYVVVPVWLDYIREGFDAKAGGLTESAIARKRQAMEADILLLDDLGAQSQTSWADEQLYQVLNARYNAQTPTVVATNLLPQQLEGRIRSRLSDRRLVEEFVLDLPDQRPRVHRG